MTYSFSIWQYIFQTYSKNWCMAYRDAHTQMPESLLLVTMTLARAQLTIIENQLVWLSFRSRLTPGRVQLTHKRESAGLDSVS